MSSIVYYYTPLNIIGVASGFCLNVRSLDGKTDEGSRLIGLQLVGVIRNYDLLNVLPLEQLLSNSGDRLKFCIDESAGVGITSDEVLRIECPANASIPPLPSFRPPAPRPPLPPRSPSETRRAMVKPR